MAIITTITITMSNIYCFPCFRHYFRHFAYVSEFHAHPQVLEVGTNISLTLELLKLRHRKVKQLAQGYTAYRFMLNICQAKGKGMNGGLWTILKVINQANLLSRKHKIFL